MYYLLQSGGLHYSYEHVTSIDYQSHCDEHAGHSRLANGYHSFEHSDGEVVPLIEIGAVHKVIGCHVMRGSNDDAQHDDLKLIDG